MGIIERAAVEESYGSDRGHSSDPAALALQADAAGRGRRARPRRRGPRAVRLGPRVVAVQSGLDHHLPRSRRPSRSPAWSAGSSSGRCFWHVSDEQVALYLEEHEPSLQAEIISAHRSEPACRAPTTRRTRRCWCGGWSQSAVAKCEAIDWGRNVERQPLRRHATTFAVIAVAAVALFTLGPRFLRHGLSAIFVISRSVRRRRRIGSRSVRATPACRAASTRRSPRRSPGSRPIRRR